MPDRDDPASGDAERIGEAARPTPPTSLRRLVSPDPTLADDLRILAMLQALGPTPRVEADADHLAGGAFAHRARSGAAADRRADVSDPADAEAWAEAKARVRARVLASLADDPSPFGEHAARTARPGESDATPTDRLPGVPAPGAAWDAVPRTAFTRTTISRRLTSRIAVVRAARLSAGLRPTTRRAPEPASSAPRGKHARSPRPAGWSSTAGPSAARRLTVIGATALVAAIAVACGVLASRDTLPGDPLYGVKRAAEAAGGVFAADDGTRARRDLHLATTRLDEIERMARDPTDPALLPAAIHDLDTAAVSGSRLALSRPDDGDTAAADGNEAGGPHAAVDLAAWAAAQTARLATLRPTLPQSAYPAVDDALRLLERVHRRAAAVAARLGCAQVVSGTVDDLGPLPADEPCAPRPSSGPAVTTSAEPSPDTADEPRPGSDPVDPATETTATTAPTRTHPPSPRTSGATATTELGPVPTTTPDGTAEDSRPPRADGAPGDISGADASAGGGGEAVETPATSTAPPARDPGWRPLPFTAVPRVSVR